MKKSIIIVVGIVIFLLLTLLFVRKINQSPYDEQITVFLTPTPTPDPMAPKNFLLLGYGGGKHEGGALTDTMMVLHAAPKTNSVTFLSIPRDSWIELPLEKTETVPYKINAAFGFGNDMRQYLERPEIYQGDVGGGMLASFAAEKVTGLPIAGFAAVSFQGFLNAISSLGKLTIDVPYAFEDQYYPLEGKETDVCGKSEDDMKAVAATLSGELLEREFLCRFETLKFEKKKQEMDAETALKFVRSRHSTIGGSDFGRTTRQQAFIRAVVRKVFSLGGITKIPSLAKQLFSYVSTNIQIDEGVAFLMKFPDVTSITYNSISLSSEETLMASVSANRQYILVPTSGSWEGVHTFIQTELEKLASPSATPVLKN